ncbi:MAG: metallophosphoesterase [Bacilli bacterium]
MSKKLDKVFKNAKRFHIDDNSKFVIMSDCHRGAGNSYDNFIKNERIFESAMLYYFHNNFTYIELGDGDDMWEVKNYKDIVDGHLDVFKLLKKFNDSNKLIMLYGNHDIVKKNQEVINKYFNKYYNDIKKTEEQLFNNLVVNEAIVMEYQNYNIFLLHGHQIDMLNSDLWILSRWLVRHFWRYLECIGIKDPTSAAKNYRVKGKIEKKLKKWSINNNIMIIAGHTHRPIYPKIGQSLYFNDGSCIHPNGITCIEIEKGKITLVKWVFSLKDDNIISVSRKVLAGSDSIIDFFNNNVCLHN